MCDQASYVGLEDLDLGTADVAALELGIAEVAGNDEGQNAQSEEAVVAAASWRLSILSSLNILFRLECYFEALSLNFHVYPQLNYDFLCIPCL